MTAKWVGFHKYSLLTTHMSFFAVRIAWLSARLCVIGKECIQQLVIPLTVEINIKGEITSIMPDQQIQPEKEMWKRNQEIKFLNGLLIF